MSNEWQKTYLGNICEFRSGSAFPSQYQGQGKGAYPFIKVSDMELPLNHHYILKANHWVNEEVRNKIRANIHPPGATVFAKIGIALTFNRRRLLTIPTIIDNNMMSAAPKSTDLDLRFLFYLLSTIDFNTISSGTALPYLKISDLEQIEVKIPPISEQRAIAHILGTLDDKIELNRRMNETLEQMARAIFKSWFVDFEPVRAKMSGRWKKGKSLPGLPAHLWDLFPDRLVPSELGDIPEGWGIVRLGDVSDLNWGDTNVTKKSYVSNGYTAFSAKGPDGFLPYYDYDRTGVVLSAIGENSGLTWLAQGKWSCIKNTMRFWSIDESLPTEYLFYATCNKIFWPIRGSAQPFISQQDARNTLIMRPIGPLGKYFGNMVEPLHKKSFYVSTESKQLASLRDILLPRLISGKIHISAISNL